jgi:hypothetical protein
MSAVCPAKSKSDFMWTSVYSFGREIGETREGAEVCTPQRQRRKQRKEF